MVMKSSSFRNAMSKPEQQAAQPNLPSVTATAFCKDLMLPLTRAGSITLTCARETRPSNSSSIRPGEIGRDASGHRQTDRATLQTNLRCCGHTDLLRLADRRRAILAARPRTRARRSSRPSHNYPAAPQAAASVNASVELELLRDIDDGVRQLCP